jgi:hypothetical protein
MNKIIQVTKYIFIWKEFSENNRFDNENTTSSGYLCENIKDRILLTRRKSVSYHRFYSDYPRLSNLHNIDEH